MKRNEKGGQLLSLKRKEKAYPFPFLLRVVSCAQLSWAHFSYPFEAFLFFFPFPWGQLPSRVLLRDKSCYLWFCVLVSFRFFSFLFQGKGHYMCPFCAQATILKKTREGGSILLFLYPLKVPRPVRVASKGQKKYATYLQSVPSYAQLRWAYKRPVRETLKKTREGGKFFPLFPFLFRCIFSFAREETLMAGYYPVRLFPHGSLKRKGFF